MHRYLCLTQVAATLLRFLVLLFQTQARLAAENLALRAQSEICAKCRPSRRRLPLPSKITIVVTDRFFAIRHHLPLISPRTVRNWAASLSLRLFWLRARRLGRPPLPQATIEVLRRLAVENKGWSVREIARKATAYLGLRVSPTTVRKYLPPDDPRKRRRRKHEPSERWGTFIRNHSAALLACDFAVQRTLWGGVLYVLVVMEIGTRRIAHANVTAHPTAEWTIQQFRQCLPGDHPYRFIVHDRDSIFSQSVDTSLRSFGVKPLRTPIRSPRANAFCERLIGTLRHECLDWIIPVGENHLRRCPHLGCALQPRPSTYQFGMRCARTQ